MKNWDSFSREQLIEQLHKKDAEVATLLSINSSMRKHFHLESLLKQIMNSTRELLSSEACSLLLVDQDSGKLFFYVTDDSGKNLSEIYLEKGQGIVGSVVESGKALIVQDVKSDPRFFAGVDAKTGFVTRSLMCVPMILEGRVLGAVEILNHKDGYYSDADANLLEMVGSQAALAIEYVKATEKRSLDERMATVGSMAASIIHDLRNSMQVIGGYTQLIAMESPSTTRYCDIIRGEIDKLIGMSQELLEYSRGNKIQLSCVTVGLNAFVSSIYSFNKESLEQLAIELNFESDNDAQISIDVDKMTRVLQNIVNNARDSLESRDVKKISLFAGLRDGVPAIGVTDTGKGMDQQTLESLFKPFFTKGKKGGTGLGMAIVKNILSAHGAVIQVESEPDKGSSFWISFPESQE